ncbi:MAG: TonB-dependent receptor plug domain-containing protein [Gemmatimonadetes bacterium]|nr:TonB-dependent receptor plug domain-containing protein [Gemmatimonadota bacterium]NNM06916.1 TonB-dependent receptor plug domain-containing protein [Gemmatimonadota bacterium]
MKLPPVRSALLLLTGSLLPWVLSPPAVSCQPTGVIRGTVLSSATGEALSGVKVTVEGGELEAETGKDGQFTLEGVPSGAVQLRLELLPVYVSSIEQVTVRPGVATRVTLEMFPEAYVLEELRVTARPAPHDALVRTFRPGEARALTGGGSAVDLIAYSFSGIQVSRGSGAAGSGSRILIRGINSLTAPGDPLVFVDGVRMGDVSSPTGAEAVYVVNVLDMIPADIISRIEVLKGPSATRFGVGSSNGVILIFTR